VSALINVELEIRTCIMMTIIIIIISCLNTLHLLYASMPLCSNQRSSFA